MVDVHRAERTGTGPLFRIPVLALLAGVLFCVPLPAQDLKKAEERAKQLEELAKQIEGAGGNPDALEKLTKEMEKLSGQMADAMLPERCAGYANNPTHGCAPITVHVSQLTEYESRREVQLQTGIIPAPPPKVIVDQAYTYAYEAEEEGELVYARDFADFRLRAPYKPLYGFKTPTKFKVTRAQGYRQGVHYNSTANRNEVKRHNDTGFKAIDSINKTFSLTALYNPSIEQGTTNLSFGAISIIVGNTDTASPGSATSSYDALGIDAVRTSTGVVNFIMTPAMVKTMLETKSFTRTIKWGYAPDQLGGYHRSTLTLTITVGEACDEPGVLAVSPPGGMASSGPDDQGCFQPTSKTYILRNVGGADITFTAAHGVSWLTLSATGGTLAPGQARSVTVSIAAAAAKLPDGMHKDTVVFTNASNGKGSTARDVTLDVGEEQRWRVRLAGQETDDMGGKKMYMKLEKAWKEIIVNYGIRFDFKLEAEFTIKKRKGKWQYEGGRITQAQVAYSSNFDPTVFSVTKYAPKGFHKVTQLKGQSLKGEVLGTTVRLIWPHVVPAVEVTNRIKLEKIAKDGEGEGYSRNWFEANEFMHLTWEHYLPLKNGSYVPTPVKKSSYKDRFRLDTRPPVSIYHRYFMTRLK